MVLRGMPVKAAEAREMVLVNWVVSLTQLQEQAQELADVLASRPARALRAASSFTLQECLQR